MREIPLIKLILSNTKKKKNDYDERLRKNNKNNHKEERRINITEEVGEELIYESPINMERTRMRKSLLFIFYGL